MTRASEEAGFHREQEQVDRSTSRILGADTLDQDARDLAQKALSRIDSHEVLCTERWNQQRVALALVQATLDVMNKSTLGRIPAGIIATLTAIVGWLAARAFPLH